MQYDEIIPAPHLARHVERLWVFRFDAAGGRGPHVIVPDGAVSIYRTAWPGGGGFIGVTGPSQIAHRSPETPGAVVGGVRLRPGAAGSVLGLNVRRLRDKVGPLALVLPELDAALAGVAFAGTPDAAYLERLADALVARAGPLDEAATGFADAIVEAGGDGALATLAAASGLSERQMRRRFQMQCGLGPKEFARLRRMRRACAAILTSRSGSLALAAMEAGFADQAHMAREFASVFGDSATLVMEYIRGIEHGGFIADAV
jgi:AraC-like DNA-binding protein